MNIFSAIDDFHSKNGCKFQEYEGINLPLSYEEGIEKEIQLMQSSAGIIDLKAFTLVSMEGPEAATFLQGMVSNDVLQIKIGEKQSNLLSHPKGKILYHLEVLRTGEEEYLILTNAGEGVFVGGYLDHFHIREDLEIKLLTPDYLRCDLIGPSGERALCDLGYEHQMRWKFQNHPMVSVQSHIGTIPRFVNIVPLTIFAEFLKLLLKTEHNLGLVGFEAYDEIRIDVGIPRAGVDYTQDNFPQEAALMDHISYKKGCYIGQETHARMYHRGHPNWQSVAIAVPINLKLQVGSDLFRGQDKIGKVTSLSRIEKDGQRRGIAFIKYQYVKDQVPLAIRADEDEIIEQSPLSTFQISTG
ncbi:MAG: hypothetical protein HQM13_23035 [SAR324 cluster bacterium]|nr:hypothetical protein [SAR324 cluster bacterium]